ncbi:MAG TPA: PPOX class F420-dependent oxidoreductase [Dictyobacter sp.]|jgi:PPOX class probable F420-dependent enzyme|nr:PPOX class F420-dependent oxidoreductase [Dictyobacter sp.]
MATITSECKEFLLQGTRTGKVATVRADGRAHVVPIWFVMDGDTIVFTTGTDSVKGKNLRRDGRASLCVDDETPPFSFATVEGTVTFSEDLNELREWATRIAARYMGADKAEQFGARNAVPGELLVRLTPTKAVFVKDLAD